MKTFYRAIFLSLSLAITVNTAEAQSFDAERMRNAVLSNNWSEIDSAAEGWMQTPALRPDASVLRGYAALATGKSSTGMMHFVRANLGKSDGRIAKWFDALANDKPNSALAQVLAGDLAARQGDRAVAMKRLDNALKLDPELHVGRLTLAMLQMLNGESEQVLKDLALLEKTPVAPDALVLRSLIYTDAGYFARANDDLKRALQLAPDHAVALNTLGILLTQREKWKEASEVFSAAFRQAPDLAEARANYNLVEAAAKHGSTIETKHFTFVVADKDKMNGLTASASEVLRGKFGDNPIITDNVSKAVEMAGKHPVILQVHDGLGSVLGENVLKTLKSVNDLTHGKSSVDIFAQHHDAAQNATAGVLRFTNVPSPSKLTQVKSIQLIDPTEFSGIGGKTPLMNGDTKGLAENAAKLIEKSIGVTVYTTQDKPGLQHIGNIKEFQDKNVPVYSTPWKGNFDFGLSLSAGLKDGKLDLSPKVGLSTKNFNDSAGTLNASSTEWTLHGSSYTQSEKSSLTDLLSKNFGKGADVQKLPDLSWKPQNLSSNPGGVLMGVTNIPRGEGGKVVIGGKDSGKLLLVYTLFSSKAESPSITAKSK